MRYFTEKPAGALSTRKYTCECNHPLYSSCSLIQKNGKGLAIVQRRFNSRMKVFWYSAADSWVIDNILKHDGFESYFAKHGGECKGELYPTVTIRQIMWALKMKPLKKSWWESQDKQFL